MGNPFLEILSWSNPCDCVFVTTNPNLRASNSLYKKDIFEQLFVLILVGYKLHEQSFDTGAIRNRNCIFLVDFVTSC